MSKTDVTIIGAGIIGLATAYQLLSLHPHLKIEILEKECKPALHQTGRNSGVIHSGIYYQSKSLKAKNCIAGKQKLLDFCNRFSIPTKKVGKIIAATRDSEIPLLHNIYQRGIANGLENIHLISKEQAKEIEPFISCVESIHIPDCSIVNYVKVAQELTRQLQEMGAILHFNEQVLNLIESQNELVIETKGNTFRTKKLINCAGLYSDQIARLVLKKRDLSSRIIPFRGEYFEVVGEKAKQLKGLIYPVRDPRFPFLGVHLTKMMDGKIEAGPNAVLALAREGYNKRDIHWKELRDIVAFSGFWKLAMKHWKVGAYELYRSFSKKAFLKDLQKLMPTLEAKDLRRAHSGVRAQIVTKNGTLPDDFFILKNKNMTHVLNAPSPAATSCFSIAEHIAKAIVL